MMFKLIAHCQVHDLARVRIAGLITYPILEISNSGGFDESFEELLVAPDVFALYSEEYLNSFNTFILHTLSFKDIANIVKRLNQVKKVNVIILCHNARSLSCLFRNLLSLLGLYEHKKERWLLQEDILYLIAEKLNKKIIGNYFIAPEMIDIIPFNTIKKQLLKINVLMEEKFYGNYFMTKYVARNFLIVASDDEHPPYQKYVDKYL